MLACKNGSQGVFTILTKPNPLLRNTADAIARVTLPSI